MKVRNKCALLLYVRSLASATGFLFQIYVSLQIYVPTLYTEDKCSCCVRNCLAKFNSDEKKECYDLFKRKSVHEQRQFLLDLLVASQSIGQRGKLQVT